MSNVQRGLSMYLNLYRYWLSSGAGTEQPVEELLMEDSPCLYLCLYWLSSGAGTEQWTDELQAENSRCMLLFVLTQLWGWNRAVTRWATSRELCLYVTVFVLTQLSGWNTAVINEQGTENQCMSYKQRTPLVTVCSCVCTDSALGLEWNRPAGRWVTHRKFSLYVTLTVCHSTPVS